MPRTIACPRETDLLVVATDDEPPPRLLSHLASCRSCRACVRRLRREIARLRSSRERALASTPFPNPEDG